MLNDTLSFSTAFCRPAEPKSVLLDGSGCIGGSDGQAPLPAHWTAYMKSKGLSRETLTHVGGMTHLSYMAALPSFSTDKLGRMNVCACKHVMVELNLKQETDKKRKHWDTCLHGWFMHHRDSQHASLLPTPRKALPLMMEFEIPPKKKRRT